MTTATMRAAVYKQYGSTTNLSIEQRPIPEPGPDQVLIKLAATAVNLSDWECLTGAPLYARIGGLRRPANEILGSDIAGQVVAVGSSVTDLDVGVAVVGDVLDTKGGFAEYVTADVSLVMPKPDAVTFVQAAAVPQSSAIALQGTAGVEPGMRVAINGGGGGTGPFAIQLAARAGAHVTAIDTAAKAAFMTDLGADETIDYQASDFTRGEPFDMILDLVAHRSVFAYRRALKPGGRYRWVGGSVATMARVATIGALAGRITGRRIGVLAVREGPEHFAPMFEHHRKSEVAIVIDSTFALDEVPEALDRVGSGLSRGKVVIEFPE